MPCQDILYPNCAALIDERKTAIHRCLPSPVADDPRLRVVVGYNIRHNGDACRRLIDCLSYLAEDDLRRQVFRGAAKRPRSPADVLREAEVSHLNRSKAHAAFAPRIHKPIVVATGMPLTCGRSDTDCSIQLGEWNIATSMSVCLSVGRSVCLSASTFPELHVQSKVK